MSNATIDNKENQVIISNVPGTPPPSKDARVQSKSKSKHDKTDSRSNQHNGTHNNDDDLRNNYETKIKNVAQQTFPTLEITQESVDLLNNFLLESLEWIVSQSGQICTTENSDWISSRHVQLALRKLLVGSVSRNSSLDGDEMTSLTASPSPTPSRNVSTPVLNSLLRVSTDDMMMKSFVVDNTPEEAQQLEKIRDYFKEVDDATSAFLELANCGDSASGGTDDKAWVKAGMKEDVYFSKKGPCLRGVADIDKPAKVVFEYLKDFTKRMKWDTLLQEVKVIEDIDKYTQIVYMKYGYGGCLLRTQRDFCIISHWFAQADGSYVHVAQSTTHELCPVSNGVLRGIIHKSGYIVCPKDDGSSCVVTHCVKIDLNDAPTPVASIVQHKQLAMLSRLRFHLTGSRICVKK